MAKKPTSEQRRNFYDTLEDLEYAGKITGTNKVRAASLYKTGLKSTREILDDMGVQPGMSDAEYKSGTDLRGTKSIRDKAKAEGKKLPRKLKVGTSSEGGKLKGGGKIYASMDKKYGGGIYPRKPTNG